MILAVLFVSPQIMPSLNVLERVLSNTCIHQAGFELYIYLDWALCSPQAI